MFQAAHDRSGCLKGTRIDILRDLEQWAASPNDQQIFWLNGHAGSGKSSIAQSFSERLFSSGLLGASFFCSRNSQKRSDMKMIFPTIAWQLARAKHDAAPKFREALIQSIIQNPSIASLVLQNQLDELIIKPTRESGMGTVIVIDALDECSDEAATSLVLSELSRIIEHIPSIKIFITSRPETNIRAGFRLSSLKSSTQTIRLHEVQSTSAEKDIRLFLETKFKDLAASRSDVDLQLWPKEGDMDDLMRKCDGLFIFAATAVKFIFDPNTDPKERLQRLLDEHGVLFNLDALYLSILRNAFADNDGAIPHLRSILGLLLAACDSLNALSMKGLLGINILTPPQVTSLVGACAG